MVYGKITKGLPTLRRPKLSKKSQEKEDEIKKHYMKLIENVIIGNSNYIGTSLNRLILEVKSKGENSFQSLQFFYINKNDRTSKWVGHSDLKELDNTDLFDRKQMIEDMEE